MIGDTSHAHLDLRTIPISIQSMVLTEIKVAPRSRTLVSRPCSSAWSVTGAMQGGGAVVFAGEGQSAEPGRPVLVEVALDPEFVVGRRVWPGLDRSSRRRQRCAGAHEPDGSGVRPGGG